MGLHYDAYLFVDETKIFAGWPALLDLFERVAEQEHFGWVLCNTTFKTYAGEREDLAPLVAAYGCMQTSILLVDDLLDEDPKGMQHKVGVGNTANMALAFQAAGNEMIIRSNMKDEVKVRIIEKLNEMMYLVALGQKMDTECWETEEKYWEIAKLKSSPFSGIALEIGGIAAEVTDRVLPGIRRWGEVYGEFMQISDDMRDVMTVPATDDWAGGRHPLPILYTEQVDHPKRERFLELRDQVQDDEKLKEAQQIMIECGAFSYCLDQFFKRVGKGRKILKDMNLRNDTEFYALESHILKAPRKILEELGVEDIEKVIRGES